MSQASTPARPKLFSVLAVIVLLALVLAITVAKTTGRLDAETAVQAIGSLFSLLMIGAGNLLPKRAAAPHTASRTAGWILVLGGVASLALWWLIQPDIRIQAAAGTALVSFAAAILAALLHLRRGSPAAGPVQKAVLQILHALMWSFAMLLAAVTQGGPSVLWLTVGFSVSMSLLQVCLGRAVKTSP